MMIYFAVVVLTLNIVIAGCNIIDSDNKIAWVSAFLGWMVALINYLN